MSDTTPISDPKVLQFELSGQPVKRSPASLPPAMGEVVSLADAVAESEKALLSKYAYLSQHLSGLDNPRKS